MRLRFLITSILALVLGAVPTVGQPAGGGQPEAASRPTEMAPEGGPALSVPPFVWVEGESALETNVPNKMTNPAQKWLNGDNISLLSGGDTLAGLAKASAFPKPCYANYRFDSPAAATYKAWFRHGSMTAIGAFRYRFLRLGGDGQPVKKLGAEDGWLRFDTSAQVSDIITIGQFRTLGWSKQAEVRLEKGAYALELQFTGPNPSRAGDPNADVWVSIDAICLVAGAFTPQGALKPGEAEAAAGAHEAAGYVWIEAEAAEHTNVSPPSLWLKGDRPTLLSHGDALTAQFKAASLPKPCFANYRFASPADGLYDVWFRHGYMGNIGAMRYRFVKLDADGKPIAQPGPDDGWEAFDQKAPVANRVSTGQFRSIEWSKQGQAHLEKSNYRLELQVTGPNPNKESDANADLWVVLDAICLTTQPFTPSGATKPGEQPETAAVGLPPAPQGQ